jgi:hypothetical protein
MRVDSIRKEAYCKFDGRHQHQASIKAHGIANAVRPIARSRLGSSLAPYCTPTPTAKIYLPFSIHVSKHTQGYATTGRRSSHNINPAFDSINSADVFGTAAAAAAAGFPRRSPRSLLISP